MKKTDNPQEFLTVKELAARWRVGPMAIYQNKDLTPDFPEQIRPLGQKSILFRMSDVIAYEKRHRI